MASQVRVGSFIYRINPEDDTQMQRRSIGSNTWSYVTNFNGYHILDMLPDANGKDILVYTDHYVYVRLHSGGVRRK